MTARRPRVGFLGTGWIGFARLEALHAANQVEVAGLCDSNPECLAKAGALVPDARRVERYEDLLALDLDGVVIATPSGLHAQQCVSAFERGCAVFCQKPLARNVRETRRVLDAARQADRLLAVDFCYRETQALSRLREVVRSGQIGKLFAVELVFHNAYGPDKSWARDVDLAGGGCLLDLGVHLIDAVLWTLDAPRVEVTSSHMYRAGAPLRNDREVEDFANGSFTLPSGAAVTFACSWTSSFGDHARIRAQFFGTEGGACFENIDGSFFDFKCERYRGTSRETLFSGKDAWGGRAIVAWAEALAKSPRHRPTQELMAVAEAVDALYERSRGAQPEQRSLRADALGAS